MGVDPTQGVQLLGELHLKDLLLIESLCARQKCEKRCEGSVKSVRTETQLQRKGCREGATAGATDGCRVCSVCRRSFSCGSVSSRPPRPSHHQPYVEKPHLPYSLQLHHTQLEARHNMHARNNRHVKRR